MTVQDLGKQTQAFLDAARQRPELANLFTSFNPLVPQVEVELDREKARTLGVPINDVFAALSASMGGAYVNDFNRFGRLYRVYVQAEPAFRQKPDDIGRFYVRSTTTNEMVPLSTLMTISSASGTEITTRFNLFRSVELTGVPGPGYTSGQAMTALEETATQVLPREMGFAYTASRTRRRRRRRRGRRSSWRSSSCSCCWPHSTTAGSSRGRCCSRRRSLR